jgi:hypothetical protein
MEPALLAVVAFALAFALQWFKRWWWASLLFPTAAFVALVLFVEFVLPYGGGGASMWPLALIFGIPLCFAVSVFGLLFAWLCQPDKEPNDAL